MNILDNFCGSVTQDSLFPANKCGVSTIQPQRRRHQQKGFTPFWLSLAVVFLAGVKSPSSPVAHFLDNSVNLSWLCRNRTFSPEQLHTTWHFQHQIYQTASTWQIYMQSQELFVFILDYIYAQCSMPCYEGLITGSRKRYLFIRAHQHLHDRQTSQMQRL